MVIPKSFHSNHDFESMILTSILGTFMALKDDLISLKQAESYWLSEITAKIFEELSLSDEVVALIYEGVELVKLENFPRLYNDRLDSLINMSKELIGKYYTEYDQDSNGIIN